MPKDFTGAINYLVEKMSTTLHLEDDNLSEFKKHFNAHLHSATHIRDSQQPVLINRRLDSLARLLERDLTCAAVMYDTARRKMLIAVNKIHNNSYYNNNSIRKIKHVMNLISDFDLSFEAITQGLIEIVRDNLLQEERFLINNEKLSKENLEKLLIKIFKDLTESTLPIKQWRNNLHTDIDYPKKYLIEFEISYKLFKKIVTRVARLTRDYIKLRKSLKRRNDEKSTSQYAILTAIYNHEADILRVGKKDGHAETKMIEEKNNNLNKMYIGISKLCCAQCKLALNAVGAQARGHHGRRFDKWFIPKTFFDNAQYLKLFLGEPAYQSYTMISANLQQEAINYVESKTDLPIIKKR